MWGENQKVKLKKEKSLDRCVGESETEKKKKQK